MQRVLLKIDSVYLVVMPLFPLASSGGMESNVDMLICILEIFRNTSNHCFLQICATLKNNVNL